MESRLKIFIPIILTLLLAGCSNTRHLPKGEALYTGATVTMKDADVKVKEKKTLRSDLQGLTRPKPNSKILGMRLKLSIYNMFRKAKEGSFFGKFRDKNGEPPVLLSDLDLARNTQVLQNHLENKGFFNAKVTGDTTVRRKKAKAHYTAFAGDQYKINKVIFEDDSSDLTQTIVQSIPKTLLKPGEAFDLDVIKGERVRIDAFLKERGFYYFSPDFILVKVDSTIGDRKIDLKVTVKPDIPTVAREIFRVNDVYVYSNYSLNTASIDTNKTHAEFYEAGGYTIIDKEKLYKPSMFAQAIQFDPGDVYNRTEHNLTLNRLINFNLFKFVKNRFEPVTDSPRLDVYYYLTPLPKKSIRAEIGANTRSNNLNGSQLNFRFHNRNTFRGGEHFDLNVFVGSDVQFSGSFQGYNTFRAGAEANFAMPRFVIPIFDFKTRGGYVPRTNIQVGYEVLKRQKLYTMNSFRGAFGYIWKENLQKAHEFYPISITYAQPVNVTILYDSIRKANPTLQKVVEQQFILGSTYQYTYNQLATPIQPTNAFYFNGLADVSGNVAGLFFRGDVKNGDTARIFNLPFSQYIKVEADGRYYRRLGLKSTWANRIIFGYGLPYANSSELPYLKQFFIGGNNSVRAFRSRSIGPGTYLPDTILNFLPDQTGDIKFEVNTEFRPHITGPLYGAVFLDAGNIWLKNKNPLKPGAEFSGKFLSQLAVGAGVGLRLDITLFVIRLDVAFPIRKPWRDPGDRWVINEIEPAQRQWRRENIVFNLAIGYPF